MRRRDFLSLLGAGLAGAAAASCRGSTSGGERTLEASPQPGPRSSFTPDVELTLTASPRTVPILPGASTRVWSYSATALSGPPGTLENLSNTHLGPIVRLRTGQKVRIRFDNQLPDSTIVHWHGLHVPETMDGHPRFLVPHGGRYVYEFEVVNRAGTYWYHPHHHTRTGPQVHNGLAGVMIVSDDAERALSLPSGSDDIVCVLQDRTFDAGNQWMYEAATPMASMNGFLGDRVLVNGQVNASWTLATRAYRVRFLNGSNSRIYKLAWSDGTPMTVIGTDGGLLEHPAARPYVTLIPGERADVILDLRRHAIGSSLQLRSLEFPTAPFEMGMGMGMGMMARQRSTPNGAPFSILTIAVQRGDPSSFELPKALSSFDASWRPDRNQSDVAPRVLPVQFGMMQWLLNGRPFEMDQVASNEIVSLGSKEVWEFDNTSSGMMGMRLGHPLHLHGRQFRILERHVDSAGTRDWESLRVGFNDDGWKDTVLVMPGERVRILVHFTRYTGLFLYHCHNLEHEDMGMMRNYRVT